MSLVFEHSFENSTSGSDTRQLWRYARLSGTSKALRSLHARDPLLYLLTITLDWSLVFLAVYSVQYFGWWIVPLALVVIGSRQRALVVLCHDGSHYGIHANRLINDLIANIFLALPMLMTVRKFRDLHSAHHRHLGDPEHDTDYLHSEEDIAKGWWHVYSKLLFSPASWFKSGVSGFFLSVGWSTRLAMILWWIVFTSILTVAAGPRMAVLFLVLWSLARAIVHHAIISFVILSDHVGLWPGESILSFARNHPELGTLRHIVHPHHNGYHLTHHLLPGLPFFSLPKAHQILLGWPRYSKSAHCSSYLIGPNSVIRSWARKSPLQAEPDEVFSQSILVSGSK